MHNVLGYDFTLMTKEDKTAAAQEAIKQIIELFKFSIIPWTDKENVRLYVVLTPVLSEVLSVNNEYMALNKQLTELNIEYLNLNDSLSRYNKPEQLYWHIDAHFNSTGYNEAARLIYSHFFKR